VPRTETPSQHFPSEAMNRRELVLAISGLLICIFLAAIDSSIVNTALPRIASELRGFELYAWVTTGYLLSSTAVVPVVGKLGDRYGRKLLIIGGTVFFLVITALCGFAQDMPQLIALRTLQGIGGGIMMATVFGSMGELLTPVARARISGLITATFSAANVLGPVVGGFLTDAFSWRAIFYANLPFGVLALAALWRAFPAARPSKTERKPIDLWGAVSITAATVLFLLALGWGGHEYAWNSPVLIGTLLTAVLLLGLFVSIEAKAIDPVVPLGLFSNNVVALSALGGLLHQMAFFGASLFIPLFIQGVLGASATVSGGLLTPMVLSMLIVNVGAGLAIAQFGRYKGFLLAGFGISTAGFGLLATAGTSTAYTFLILCMVTLGIGSGCLVGTLNLAAQNAARIGEMGVVTSFTQYSRSMGGTLGSAILGSILLAQLGPQAQLAGISPLAGMREPLAEALRGVFLTGAALMALGLLASAYMRELPMRRPRAEFSPTPSEPYRPPTQASGAPHRH
jgi:EmrB/QacA subfamily drug resistance transporter